MIVLEKSYLVILAIAISWLDKGEFKGFGRRKQETLKIKRFLFLSVYKDLLLGFLA